MGQDITPQKPFLVRLRRCVGTFEERRRSSNAPAFFARLQMGELQMVFGWAFFLNSVLLGVGLAMDAFSVSAADGLAEPSMRKRKMFLIAGIFGLFQTLMPLIGWICVHTVVGEFTAFQRFIPWIAFLLLGYIGGKMLLEGIRHSDVEKEDSEKAVTFRSLLIQAVATSIDALSVGFAIAELSWLSALVETLIIGVVTALISFGGLLIGRKFGTKLSQKASVLGGLILIAIGLEILISGLIG